MAKQKIKLKGRQQTPIPSSAPPPPQKEYGALIAFFVSMLIAMSAGLFFFVTYKSDKAPESAAHVDNEKSESKAVPQSRRPQRTARENDDNEELTDTSQDKEITEKEISQPFPLLRKDIVWQAGQLNGFPKSPQDASSPNEYRAHRRFETNVKVSSPDDLPQVMRGKQKITLSLSNLQKKNYVLRAVFNTGLPRKDVYLTNDGNDYPTMSILFNGRVMFNKTLPHSSNWVTILLPADSMQNTNEIVFTNKSNHEIGIDAILVHPATPEKASWLALEDSEWLDKKRASRLSHMAVTWYPPCNPVNSDELKALAKTSATGIGSIAERQRQWKRFNWKNATLPTMADSFNELRQKVKNIIGRGAEPVVIVRSQDVSYPIWLQAYTYLRHYVKYWYIDAEGVKQLSNLASIMRKLSPEGNIGFYYRGNLIPQRELLTSTGICLSARSTFLMDEKANRVRQALLRSRCISEIAMAPTLYSRHLSGCRGIKEQAGTLMDITGMTIDWLNSGGGPIIFSGGELGGSIFPEAASHPTQLWDTMKLLLPLCQGNGYRMHTNLVPASEEEPLNDASWYAVSNSASSITLLIHTIRDRERDVTIECQTPWKSGSIDVKVTKIEQMPRIPGQAVTQSLPRLLTDKADEMGVVRFTMKLDNFQKLTFTRKGGKEFKPKTLLTKASRRKDITYNPRLFEVVRDRELGGKYWREETTSTTTLNDCTVLSNHAEAKVITSTPSTLGKKKNLVPWAGKSLLLTVRATSDDDYPEPAASLYISKRSYSEAAFLELWVLPTTKNGKKNITFRAGVKDTRGEVHLKYGIWQAVRIPLKKLAANLPQNNSFELMIWPDSDDLRNNDELNLEMNIIHGIGKYAPGGKKVSQQSQLIETSLVSGARVLLFGGPNGQPCFHTGKFSKNFDSGDIANVELLVKTHYESSQTFMLGTKNMQAKPIRPENLSKESRKKVQGYLSKGYSFMVIDLSDH